MMDEYTAFTHEIQQSGEMVSGEVLQPPEATTAVRVRDGKTIAPDGPFVVTKEILGGYYTVECDSLDRAIELAAQIPDARGGVVEIRPVVVFAATQSDPDGTT